MMVSKLNVKIYPQYSLMFAKQKALDAYRQNGLSCFKHDSVLTATVPMKLKLL